MSGVSPVIGLDGLVQEHAFQIGDMSAALPAPAPVAARSVQIPPASPPMDREDGDHVKHAEGSRLANEKFASGKAPEKQELNTREVISLLKRRLRFVEREIKSRKALEKERDQIKRLIAAALTERDNVRQLRSAG
jgi:hypothetical protein